MGATTPVCDFGWPAPDFALPATDGRTVRFADVAGPNGTLVMFICNHCPYVQAVLTRILRDARDLAAEGIGIAAISSNDVVAYPEDSLPNMAALAEEEEFPFPYLWDETQEVARAYGAVCTPDFFGFNAAGELQYRGRLDASTKATAPIDARRELYEAMVAVARTGRGPAEQVPSIGCGIKWREAPRLRRRA
jgi:peroxiredoxin